MSPGPVTIDRAARRAMVAEARQARPRECCGFLLGHGRHVAHIAPMRNAARGTRRYRIAPEDHIALRRVVRDWVPPIAIVGVYHSHPAGAARPSVTDLAEAHYPEWVHVIVGLEPRLSVRAFVLPPAGAPGPGPIRPVPIRLVSSRVGPEGRS